MVVIASEVVLTVIFKFEIVVIIVFEKWVIAILERVIYGGTIGYNIRKVNVLNTCFSNLPWLGCELAYPLM